MKVPKHTERARKVLAHLEGWGFSFETQQRLGSFGIVWGIFETNLESTIWALQEENVAGVRPSTDKSRVSDWIKAFGKGSSKFGPEVQVLLHLAALTAIDLMEYRHALVHGWLLPFPSGPMFIRNPRWNGERRKHQSSDAHADENLLDMAIDVAWVLCQVVFATRSACKDLSESKHLLSLKADLRRARGQAAELRHLTALVNDENY